MSRYTVRPHRQARPLRQLTACHRAAVAALDGVRVVARRASSHQHPSDINERNSPAGRSTASYRRFSFWRLGDFRADLFSPPRASPSITVSAARKSNPDGSITD